LLKFNQIDITTKPGKAQAAKIAKELSDSFNKEFKGKLIVNDALLNNNQSANSTATSKTNPLNSKQEKLVKDASASIASQMAAVTTNFAKQNIKAAEYKETISNFPLSHIPLQLHPAKSLISGKSR
jgi:nitrogen fixation/metabolism regulation signal transduction histidine kinase